MGLAKKKVEEIIIVMNLYDNLLILIDFLAIKFSFFFAYSNNLM